MLVLWVLDLRKSYCGFYKLRAINIGFLLKRESSMSNDARGGSLTAFEVVRLILNLIVVCVVVLILVLAVQKNSDVFVLEEQNKKYISEAFNALVLLTIPYLLGIFGAVARLLLSGVRIIGNLPLIGGSALMASFSWIGIKSGVLIAIVAPHIAHYGVESKEVISGSSNFYTMALVAVIVGMFSTNLYLLVSAKVDKISNATTGG